MVFKTNNCEVPLTLEINPEIPRKIILLEQMGLLDCSKTQHKHFSNCGSRHLTNQPTNFHGAESFLRH